MSGKDIEEQTDMSRSENVNAGDGSTSQPFVKIKSLQSEQGDGVRLSGKNDQFCVVENAGRDCSTSAQGDDSTLQPAVESKTLQSGQDVGIGPTGRNDQYSVAENVGNGCSNLVQDIEELWLSNHANRVEATFEDIIFDKEALCTLQSPDWLDDKIMDTSIQLLCHKFKVNKCQPLSTHYGSLFFIEGRYRRELKRGLKDLLVSNSVCAICINRHWILMATDFASKKLLIYDPFGNEDVYAGKIMRNWKSFLRFHLRLETPWLLDIQHHGSQMDACNCGILVLKAAQSHLKGDGMHYPHDSKACVTYRREIGNYILQNNG